MHLSELKNHHVSQLIDMATAIGIEGANRLRKQELIFALLKEHAKKGETIYGDGCLEVMNDGYGIMPTVPAPLEQITESLAKTLKKIEKIPFDQIGPRTP